MNPASGIEARPRLELRGITKRFGEVVANEAITVSMRSGEVHALLGENGAGKTTLMRIASALHQPDEGSICIDGRPVAMRSPRDAMNLGIAMVHQHFTLVSPFTVVQNVILGLKLEGLTLELESPAERIRQLSDTYRLKVDPWARVEDLSVGAQQRAEILKLLYRDPQIIILDEPTSLLAPPETEHLFKMIRQWADEGRSIVFITHKLKEVFAIADQITVLRRGRVVGTIPAVEADRVMLTQMMVGKSVRSAKARGHHGESSKKDRPLLVCEGLTVGDDRGERALDRIDLELYAGEIVGVAGVEGNGQRELAEVLTGLRKPDGGVIRAFGKPLDGLTPADVAHLGIGFIPEDRRGAGLILDLSILENLSLRPMDRRQIVRLGFLHRQKMRSLAQDMMSDFEIMASDPNVLVKHLSGGNQQKVVLARELYRNPRILVAGQPTQGLDLAATEYVHQKIFDQREKGSAILFITTDLDEVLKVSDRIIVLYEGRILDTLSASGSNRERIGLLMGGVDSSDQTWGAEV